MVSINSYQLSTQGKQCFPMCVKDLCVGNVIILCDYSFVFAYFLGDIPQDHYLYS